MRFRTAIRPRHRPQNGEALRQALLVALAGLALASAGGAARGSEQQDKEVQKLPGYCDFGPMASIFGQEEAEVEVFLEPNLLSMVAAVTKSSDPELSSMLAKLKQIRVQTFKIDDQSAQKVAEKTAEVAKRLESSGWQTVVRVREKREKQTYVYMKWVDNVVQGLVVMNVDPSEEAAFVNIVGEIDPEQLGRLGRRFNIDALEDSLDFDLKGAGQDHHKDRNQDKDRNHK